MKYFVYLISTNKGSKIISYVGYTNDIKSRIIKHNSGKGAKFTKGRIWKLEYLKKYNTKSKAMSEEYKLKKNYKFRNKILKR